MKRKLFKSLGDDVFFGKNIELKRPHLMAIGSHVAIDFGCYFTTAAEIGDYVHIGPMVSCIGGAKTKIIIEDFVSIAAGSRLICGSDRFMGKGFTSITVPKKYRDQVNLSTITLKRFSGIGTQVVIMPGVTIAEGSVIGACSLVTEDTKPWTIYYGTPARAIKVRPREKMLKAAKELGYV